MKTKKIYTIIFIMSGLLLLFTSCYQRKVPEYQYSDFRRVIGPEGGVINFYEYNPKDSIPLVLVSMNFPAGALDSLMFFNMYKFYDERTFIELSNLNMFQASDFLYFMPFSESIGYNNQTQGESDYHLSIDFNVPVEITYNLKGTYFDVDSKLYRIPIPKMNDPQWIDNIRVIWNNQGSPVEYKGIDLEYLITGLWTVEDPWGTGTPSLANWVEVTEKVIIDSTVTFKINNTDSMYVMANPNVK